MTMFHNPLLSIFINSEHSGHKLTYKLSTKNHSVAVNITLNPTL